jgi:hypothetical protein
MQLVIESGGVVRCIYSEAIDLTALGSPAISRASHVEPDQHGSWWADLGPVNGPRLGPYDLRSEALAVEHAWLEQSWIEVPKGWARRICADDTCRDYQVVSGDKSFFIQFTRLTRSP